MEKQQFYKMVPYDASASVPMVIFDGKCSHVIHPHGRHLVLSSHHATYARASRAPDKNSDGERGPSDPAHRRACVGALVTLSLAAELAVTLDDFVFENA